MRLKQGLGAVIAFACAALAGTCAQAATDVPPAPEVLAAKARLVSMLAGNAQALKEVSTHTDAVMALREQECAGRWTVDQACLQRHDTELLAFYGVRTVGLLLSAPPLRAYKPVDGLVELQRGPLDPLVGGNVARDANVAMLVDIRGASTAVELSGGTVMSRFEPSPGHDPGHLFSPNGRVLAAVIHGKSVFYETETGKPIWRPDDSSKVLAWLPGLSSHLYVRKPDGQVMVADGLTGLRSAHPLTARNDSHGASMPGGNAPLLIGNPSRLQLIEHVRGAQGIQASLVRGYRVAGAGITSGSMVPMLSGKLVVYASSRNVGWLNLATGESGVWKTSPTFKTPFAKIDEKRILFDSQAVPKLRLVPWTFDVETQRVARVDIGRIDGLMIPTGDRIGFMKRGDDMWFGTRVNAGPERPLDEVAAAFLTIYCTPEGEFDPPKECPNRPPRATPMPRTLPDAASAAAMASNQLPCAIHERNPMRLRQCQQDQHRLAVRLMVTARLQLVSRNVAEHLASPSQQPGQLTTLRDGRPPAWCDAVLADIAALRNLELVDDDTLPAPAFSSPSDGRGDRWIPPAVDESFQEMPHPKGSVARGHVTVRWKGNPPLSIQIQPACADINGRTQCKPLRIHSVTLHDSAMARSCATEFVGSGYVFEPQDRLVPLRVAR